MKVDFTLSGEPGDGDLAAAAELRRYDGIWLPEITHDPFPLLAVAASRTETIELGTAIAVAFARNPMSMALVANDLQLYSGGRFLLGVGSQIKPHITKRFSMPWSAPADRMREYVLAMREIHSWATGELLNFVGEFYTHTLMTPFFNPGLSPYGNPPIILAGVGPRMTQVAGEVADGFFVHGFTTERYMRETTLRALRLGRAAVGNDNLDGFEISRVAVRCHRPGRKARSGRRRGDTQADRDLRLHTRIPAGTRDARLGSAWRRTQSAIQARRVGPDGPPDHRRDAARVRYRGPARPGRRAAAHSLRRCVHAHRVLRPLLGARWVLGADHAQAAGRFIRAALVVSMSSLLPSWMRRIRVARCGLTPRPAVVGRAAGGISCG